MKFSKTRIIFLISSILLLILGFFYLQFVWNKSLAQKSNQLTTLARAVEISLNGEMLKQLRAEPADVGTIAYESIKNRLINLRSIDPEVRFAYLYTQKDNKLYFMVDSEPEDSKDLAPAGMEYVISGTEYFEPFIDGKYLVTKPATDQWGTWVSVLVPMKESKTGEVIAVFAMDYPASQWNDEALYQTIQAGIVVVILLLLLLTFFIIFTNLFRLKESKAKIFRIKEEQEKIIDAIPAWVFYKDDKNNFIRVNKAFAEAINIPKEKLEGKSCFDLFPKDQAEAFLKDDLAVLASGKAKINIIEKMTSPKGERWVETDKIILRNDNNEPIGIIGFSLDITEKKNIDDEIKKNNEQLERVNRLMVGREMEMINLKKELANYKNK